jgi:thiol-disulfide isomerase/thioredoxin
MSYGRYSSLAVALLLTAIGGFYYWTNGNPSGYLRSQLGEDRERINEVSPEEFSRMLRKRKQRHLAEDETTPSAKDQYREARPDTKIRRRWERRFPDQAVNDLSAFGVTPARPDTSVKEIKGPDLDGEILALEDFRGRWVLLNFWASWCLPCREEMPSLNGLHRKSGENLVVLGLNIGEGRETVNEFVEEYELGFPVLRDPDGSIPRRYDVHALPETWLIDPGGNVMGLIQGPRDWSGEPIHRALESITNTRNERTR